MANNYEAIVRAVLDQRRFNSEMDALENARYELQNVHIDTSNFVREIQNAINSASFTLNINPTFNANQAQNMGRTYGQNLTRGINTAINSGIRGGGVNLLENILGNTHNVNQNAVSRIIAGITRDVGTANIQIQNMRTQFQNASDAANGLRNFRITGVDDLGNVVTNLTRIDEATGGVVSSLTTVTQNFDRSAEAARQTQQQYSQLLTIAQRIGQYELKIAGLDSNSDSNQIRELERQLTSLREEYQQLYAAASQNLSTAQLSHLGDIANETMGKISLLQSKMQDLAAANSLESSFKNLYNTAKQISKLEIKIAGLNPESDSNQINVLNGQLAKLKSTYSQLKTSLQGKLSNDQLKMLGNISEETANKVALINAKLADSKKYASSLQVITFDNEMSSWLEKNSRASKNFGASINALRDKLRTLNSSGKLTHDALKDLQNDFRSIKQEAIAAGQVGQSFGSTFSKAFRSIANYVSVASIISTSTRAIREMYEAVSDIDAAMVNLMKVTDETSIRYDKFLKNAASSAKELGRSMSSLVEQTANWAKLGYTLDQAEELAKLSSIYANVAEIDDNTAVSDMVTAMKAFNIEAEKAVNVIDPLNELGNKFATSAADLGEGLSKSASAMNAAGTDMYKTLAMLTGGAEITQNAGEFGSFLKVASMRIRGMKGELEELGEEVDESVDSISKVQTQILNLTHGKVNIFDDAGEFRDYYDIMKEISEVVDDLTSTERASLYEILFGKQRGNQGAALIQAFQSGQIEKAYETAINSAGSAAAEQEKWLEGIEAKVNQFNAAWQSLSQAILDSTFLKSLIDSGTTLLTILTNIVETVGVLPTLLAGISIALSVKNIGKDKMFSFLKNMPMVMLFPLDIMVFDVTLSGIH